MDRSKTLKLFPSRVAKGISFCNRDEERKLIQENIERIQHTLIVSPRRYGKTSLALQAVREVGVPYGYVQFFNAFRDDIVIKRFITGLSELLGQLIPKTKKAMQMFAELITHAKLSVNITGVKVETNLIPTSKDPAEIIRGLLKDIEQVLEAKEMRAVIFFDEFQDIIDSDISDELQSIVRDFAQLTDYVTFIISGSHRHMLLKMFNDSNKPFYKLFDRIDLKRISKEDYVEFIQKFSAGHWGKKISDSVVNEVLNLTGNHAYYVNRLCSKLWKIEALPGLREVHLCWKYLIEEEFPSIANDLSALTKNQRIVLQGIAKYSVLKEPSSSEFLSLVGLSPRSVVLAIDALEKTDHIEQVANGYQIIDPVAKCILIV